MLLNKTVVPTQAPIDPVIAAVGAIETCKFEALPEACPHGFVAISVAPKTFGKPPEVKPHEEVVKV